MKKSFFVSLAFAITFLFSQVLVSAALEEKEGKNKEKEYQEFIRRKTEEKKKKLIPRIEEIERRIEVFPASDKYLQKKKGEIEKEILSIKKALNKDIINPFEMQKIEDTIFGIEKSFTSLKELSEKAKELNKVMRELKGSFVIYKVNPITMKGILPDAFVPGKISDEIKLIAARGEYEPASFVIRGKENIRGLKLKVTDLKSKKGELIPSSCIDIRVVKCWYQDRGEGGNGEPYSEEVLAKTYSPIYRSGIKVLVPELLLHDEELVRVDHAEKHNFVRDKDGDYKIVSSEKLGEGLTGVLFIPTDDAPSLLPVSIQKDKNKQFWLTIKIPDDAFPGIYQGKIKFETKEKKILKELNLKVKILPFKLSKPYYISSIFYHPSYALLGSPNVVPYPMRCKHPHPIAQLKTELENLVAHGVTNPPINGGFNLLARVLKIRKEVKGIENKPIFLSGRYNLSIETGVGVSPQKPEGLKKLKKKVEEHLDTVEEILGHRDVYFYGIDEATGKKLTAQRPAWEAMRQAGGKIFVAGRRDISFPLMGDIQDLLVCARYPSREEAEKWHSKGHRIFCYGNPQGGAEQSEIYRRNFGILLWQHDYDGAMTYAWYWHYGWGDFWGKGRHKSMSMVYPTADGIIDTVQWEGYREGVDDVRYLTTLVKAIKENEKSNNEDVRKSVKEAKDYLEKLKRSDINETKADLNLIRLQIINYILKVQGLK